MTISTLTISMLLLLGLCLLSVTVASLLIMRELVTKLMRIFSEMQGVSVESMEGKPPEKEPFVPKVRKKMFSMPLPGADWIREMRKK